MTLSAHMEQHKRIMQKLELRFGKPAMTSFTNRIHNFEHKPNEKNATVSKTN